jgi:hypothetical protein
MANTGAKEQETGIKLPLIDPVFEEFESPDFYRNKVKYLEFKESYGSSESPELLIIPKSPTAYRIPQRALGRKTPAR